MLTAVVLALAGLLVLTIAADQLVLGSGRLARRLRLAPVVVGVVIIGLGTSAPEFLVSGVAAARGDTGIAIGNLVGSNVLNLTLILGIAALVAPVVVRSSVVRAEAPLTIAGTAVFAVLAVWGLGWIAGVLLFALGVAAIVVLLRWARRIPDPLLADETDHFLSDGGPDLLGREIVRTLLGLAGTIAGAQLLVGNATTIATSLGVPDVVIGFTLVALGTSLPELVTAVQAQRHGETDLLVGNLLGSNLFNSLFGGAIVALCSASTGRSASASWGLVTAMVLIGVLAWALLSRGLRVTRVEAGLLLVAYAAVLPLLA